MRLAVLFLSALLATPVLVAAPPAKPGSGSLPLNITKQFVRGGPLPRWVQPLAEIPATNRNEPVVIRLVETQSLVGATPAVMLNRAIQVNDRSSLSEIGQFGVTFFPAYQKLQLHRVAIIRSGAVMDRTATVNSRVLEREANLGNGVYGGAATVQLLLDDVRIGDTLWLTYTVEGENPVFGQRWASEFSWDSAQPIELRRLTVLHPKGRPLRWRQLGDYRKDVLVPQVDSAGGLTRIRFEGRAIEPVDFEPSIPSSYFAARMLQFSEYTDWQAVATWAGGLFPKAKPSPALKTLARQFANEAATEARASAALHWVQNQIRYFSVAIGENSHRPQAPDIVLKRRYGDCKDMTYLLISLLGELGIEAKPVLLAARAPAVIAKLAPTPTWFDHVIVQVTIGGSHYYLDPTRTGQTARIDKLPAAYPGAAALVVDPSSSGLTTLPPQNGSVPDYELAEKIIMPTLDGDATIEARRIFRQSLAEGARQYFPQMSAKELETNALAEYEKQYSGVKLQGAPVLRDDPIENRFEVVARYTVTKPASLADRKYSLEFDSKVLKGTLALPDKLVRNHPFSMPMGKHRTRYRLAVHWPDNVRPAGSPTERVIDNRYFTLGEYYVGRGNYMDYQLDLLLKREEIDAAELVALQAEGKRLADVSTALFIPETAVVAAVLQPYAYRDLDSLIASARVVESGMAVQKRQAKDMTADEICGLGIGAVQIVDLVDGENAGLIAEIADEMRGQIKRDGIGLCLARLLYATGSYQDSVKVYDGISGLQDDSDDMRQLAWARYHSGNTAGALRDMTRYISSRQKPGADRDGRDPVAQIALLQLSKQAIPAGLLADAGATPDAPWPRPLLAMQVGVLSEEAMLQRVESYPPDARAFALTEGWYYIGQRRLAAGDIEGARAAFRWLRVNGIRSSEEYMQAKAVLSRLAPSDENYRAALAAFGRKDAPAAISKLRLSASAGLAPAQRELAIALRAGNGVGKDFSQALHWFRLAAAQHDPAASNYLGIMYALGEGVPKDAKMAASWYRTAAHLGDPFAQHNLATRYENGDGLEEDPAKAFEYSRQAAEQGHAEAQADLSRFYRLAYGVARNDTLAMFWARRSSTQGNDKGQLQLGYLFDEGIGTAQDHVAARKLYLLAAKQGNSGAQFNLAALYSRGEGGARDEEAAFEWYEKAAQGGDTDAQIIVANQLFAGDGVRSDLKKARWWFERSATAGSADAQHVLALMYESGQGGPKDLEKAMSWHRKAADQGDVRSTVSLGLMFNFGSANLKDPVQAAYWYQRAVEAGSALAANNLGDLYENGVGVAQDYSRAVSLYRQSARAGFSTAFFSLATLYESGKGVQRDSELAYTYYRMAARASDKGHSDAAKRELAVRELSAVQLKNAEDAADQWTPSKPLPGERSLVESFDAAYAKLNAQEPNEQAAKYSKEWSDFNERLGMSNKGGCRSKPSGRVRLVLLLDEAGVVRNAAAEADDQISLCFKAVYLNMRFPAPPLPEYRTMVVIE